MSDRMMTLMADKFFLELVLQKERTIEYVERLKKVDQQIREERRREQW